MYVNVRAKRDLFDFMWPLSISNPFQNYTINYWLELGAPKNKLVMGMPLYGQAFTLNDPSRHGLNAMASQKGQAGEFTRAAGFLAWLSTEEARQAQAAAEMSRQ